MTSQNQAHDVPMADTVSKARRVAVKAQGAMTFRAVGLFAAALFIMSACSSAPTSDAVEDQAAPAERPVPECEQTDENADYNGIQRGDLVRLHMQREDHVTPNWAPDMEQYVDKVTRVTDTGGVDASGCPSLRVEVDVGTFFWRVRDVERIGADPGDMRCGQSSFEQDYRGFQIGDAVEIGEHSAWYGQENWAPDMDAFVGEQAKIQSHVGVDDAGCPGVTLDIDDGGHFWRVRDLESVENTP